MALYLPRCDTGTANQTESATDTGENLGGGETILVVEDEPLVRDVVVEMIRDLGYRVLAAVNGAEALGLLRGGEQIDLLFSDVVMARGISGVALAIEARQIRGELKVLLTSGYPARDGARIGPAEFPMLPKPYQRDKLAVMLRTVLDLRQPGIA